MKSQDYLMILGSYNHTNKFGNFFDCKFEQRSVIYILIQETEQSSNNQIINDGKRVRERIKKIIKILKIENNHP